MEGDTLSGADAFKLYDTYGFPVDLTRDILEEKNRKVDEKEFDRLMAAQRERARAARKNAGMDAWKENDGVIQQLIINRFVGYRELEAGTKVTAIIRDNEMVDSITEGDDAFVVLETTPFYAESGGQAGDHGTIACAGAVFEVTNTVKSPGGVSICMGTLKSGELSAGDAVKAVVDSARRQATMRNHTAAHLLQAALRRVLGSHVEQAGQWVDSRRMRFDFTHFSALSAEELHEVEALVNQWILDGLSADIREMPIDEARSLGAMALFGEKYGDVVRVVRMGDVSIELCGGTHADNTAKLGLFHILSESSVASGVRRIEAVTGTNVLEMIDERQQLIAQTAGVLRAGNPEELPQKAAQLQNELKTVQKQLEDIRAKAAASKVEGLFSDARIICGIRVIAAAFTGTGSEAIRGMCDRMQDLAGSEAVVMVLAGIQEDKGTVSFGCCCSQAAVTLGARAGDIVREVAKICGGKGGGRPDMAMAGAKDLHKVDDAINAVDDILEELLQKSK